MPPSHVCSLEKVSDVLTGTSESGKKFRDNGNLRLVFFLGKNKEGKQFSSGQTGSRIDVATSCRSKYERFCNVEKKKELTLMFHNSLEYIYRGITLAVVINIRWSQIRHNSMTASVMFLFNSSTHKLLQFPREPPGVGKFYLIYNQILV